MLANEFPLARKNLDAMIARIRHANAVLGIYAQAFWAVKFAGPIAGMAEAGHEPRGSQSYGIGSPCG